MKLTIKNINSNIKIMFLAIAATSMFACQDSFDYQYAEEDLGVYNGTAWDYINNAPKSDSLTLMKELIVTAGMESYFSQSSAKKTYIVPRNKALRANLTAATGYASYKSIPVEKLRSVLKYHIAQGEYNTQDKKYLGSNEAILFTTEEGVTPLLLSHNASYQTQVNYGTKKVFTIYISNIQPTNGVIHISSDVVYYSK